tara:strand:- start:51 stop:254 length:204 start_codon:yes stop_codon:yes gene_type:complete
MTQPKRYKDIPSLKQSPERRAAEDYSRGSYENPYARQDRRWTDYYMAFYDLVAQEGQELHAELQGEW